jgi:hypothetical protein
LRVNADNNVVALTLAQLKADLGLNTVVLPTNISNVTTAYEDVTGLSFAVTANKTYKWRATISFASTAGSMLSTNGPTASLNNARFNLSLAAGTQAINNQIAYNSGATAAVAGNGLCFADGIFRVTASGTWTIRMICTAVGGFTIRAGSVLEIEEVL